MSTRVQLASLLRAARLRRALIVLACALPALAVAVAAGWRWLGSDAASGILASLLAASALIAIGYASRLDLPWLCRQLDSKHRSMDDSSTLLLQHPANLPPLTQLQRARIATRLYNVRAADLCLAWPRTTLLSIWLLAAVAIAAVVLLPARPTAQPIQPAPVAAAEAAIILPHLVRAQIDITPPPYTGLSAYTSDELDTEVVQGARLRWRLHFEPEPAQASLMFLDGSALELQPVAGEWQGEREVSAPALYRLETGAALSESSSRLYRIQTTPDLAPNLRMIEPTQALSLRQSGQRTWILRFEASDDYGLGRVEAAMTHSQGSGENVQFSDSVTTLVGSGSAIRRQYRHAIDLDALGFAEGDDLIVRLSVRDNRQPQANVSKHPSLILRWPPPASAASDALEGIVQSTLPAYFRSQRQIIIDTEALIAERAQLSKATFVDRSDAIGVDQRILRLRYGQFLGEETEVNERPPQADDSNETASDPGHGDPDHDHDAEPAQLGDDVAVVAQFGHSHDHAEATTLFDPATRALLKSALDAMWQSEGMLRQGQPSDALPHAYRALAFIKQVQQASRIYLSRVGLELPPIDFARRLGGKPSGQRSRSDPLRNVERERIAVAAAWQALDQPADSVGNELAALSNWIIAQDDPDGALLDALAATATLRRDPTCSQCRVQLKHALWPLLPTPPAHAQLRPQLSDSARAYLDAIEQDHPDEAQP
ncbi:MAG: hypothetical protein Q8L45_09515 [Xanthomonadaceae bacterium]|nr:hypothetical protein [Xanthomonadaceae bacterium]MDP2186951.1 hypothetical protein [Xanthomonadales bacterium]MDZ4116726.1 hypothetical protein [Xanthomonadaceae bacterium]MDZ4379408.1 hypothetical protein [Xanthomonadaceae bacterium]